MVAIVVSTLNVPVPEIEFWACAVLQSSLPPTRKEPSGSGVTEVVVCVDFWTTIFWPLVVTPLVAEPWAWELAYWACATPESASARQPTESSEKRMGEVSFLGGVFPVLLESGEC